MIIRAAAVLCDLRLLRDLRDAGGGAPASRGVLGGRRHVARVIVTGLFVAISIRQGRRLDNAKKYMQDGHYAAKGPTPTRRP